MVEKESGQHGMASSVMQEKSRQRDHRQISQSGTVSGLLETLWMRNQSPENLGNEMMTFWLASLYLWFNNVSELCQLPGL